MRIANIQSYNLSKCQKPQNKSFDAFFGMQNAPKLNSLNKDTVSFTGIVINFQKCRVLNEIEERLVNAQDPDFEILQIFIEGNDDPNNDARYEKIINENNINLIKEMFESIQYEGYKDMFATRILQKINYDLTVDSPICYNYVDFITLALENMSDYSKHNELSSEIYDEIANGILTNLIIREPIIADKFLGQLDNLTAAKLMISKNDEGEYPIGRPSIFSDKNIITGVVDNYNCKYKKKKFDVPNASKLMLRQRAIKILQDDSIPRDIKIKIASIYKPNQKEHNELDEKFRKVFAYLRPNWT